MKKITGINGFGRFGLHLLKYWLDRNNVSNFDIVYINDDFLSLQNALDIIKNDPYVNFKDYEFSLSGNSLVFINKSGEKRSIEYTNKPKSEIPWIGKPDIFLECSGKCTVAGDCESYLLGNTRLVVISATSWDAKTIIYGFNQSEFDANIKVISYGSCTVNAYVPLANYIQKKYGIIDSDANFIHNIPKYKLHNFNTLQRKFCTLEKSGPKILGFINENNFTVNYTVVPYDGVSILDFRFKLSKVLSREEIIQDLENAFGDGELKGLYSFKESDNGPEEHKFTTHSAVFIKNCVRMLNGNLYLYGYFDNENSVNRYFDLINYISAS
jgi:glyceraldehyde 3-phosphate dehydrogenase